MSKKKRDVWLKLRLFFAERGKHGKKRMNGLNSKLPVNLNEEYKEAFRTKSYTDICTRIGAQIETIRSSACPGGPESSPLQMSDGLIDPRQEALISQFQGSKKPQFSVLANYFETSLDACRICESLLANVRQARRDNDPIEAVIELSKRDTWSPDIHRNLASISSQSNPFAPMTPEKFRELHVRHASLLRSLTAQCKKTKRRAGIIKVVKRVMAGFLVLGSGAVAVAVLILAIHALVAAPALVICSLSLFRMKKPTWARRVEPEALTAQLDAAARGVYIMINDFDTVSRLVRRVEDEAEHRRFVADVCVKRGGKGAGEMVREFVANEAGFMEQLEELERQICLCFLDIHRSKRLLVREIIKWE